MKDSTANNAKEAEEDEDVETRNDVINLREGTIGGLNKM